MAAAVEPEAHDQALRRHDGGLTANELTKELQKTQALYEISQMLAGTVDLRNTLQTIADAACRLIKASDRTILHLLDERQENLNPVAIAGTAAEAGGMSPDADSAAGDMPLSGYDGERVRFRPGVGIAGLVVAGGLPINVADVTADQRYLPVHMDPAADAPYRALLVVPVKATGDMLGTLSVQSRQPGAFDDDDQRLLSALGAQAAVAIEKARLYDDLQAALEHEKATRARLVQSEKLAALGRIVASVAHELNNPLQAIQNALYLIQLEQSLSPQANEDLQTVLNETVRMAGLIARLRDTYRPATSEEYQPTLLNDLVEDVRKLLATHMRHAGITFEFSPDPDLPQALLIRDQIKQVILNICLNAVEAMRSSHPETGGGRIRVATGLAPGGRAVQFSIADNGPSIDPQILPIIFDPFVTTKAGEGGTGLGLAITYDIVQRHMGRIEVDSLPGRGTTFRVWLPVAPPAPPTGLPWG
ncbi:MAG: sensor histidine kinase [Chloroflexota bacterium]